MINAEPSDRMKRSGDFYVFIKLLCFCVHCFDLCLFLFFCHLDETKGRAMRETIDEYLKFDSIVAFFYATDGTMRIGLNRFYENRIQCE